MPSVTSSPTTITSDASAGTVAWTNPGNAASSNNTYATATMGSGESTHRLNSQGYDFSTIPEGAVPVGFMVSPEGKCAGDTSAYEEVSLVVDGAVAGEDKGTGQALTTSDATTNFGGATSMWTLAPRLSQVKSTTFGSVVRIIETGEGDTASIDHVPMTVYYEMPGWRSRTVMATVWREWRGIAF